MSYLLNTNSKISYNVQTSLDYNVVNWNTENVTKMKIIYVLHEYSQEMCLYI
jgi:hypothetical protein